MNEYSRILIDLEKNCLNSEKNTELKEALWDLDEFLLELFVQIRLSSIKTES